jgi:hypothetical protein
MEEFMRDASSSVPKNQELHQLANLATKQLSLETAIGEAEKQLEELKDQLKQVQESAIPDLMASIGVKEFKLDSGYKITVREDVYASIKADYIVPAVDWLNDQGLGDVVKDEVKVNFGRGESEDAATLLRFCKMNKFPATEKLSVHPQTLKALVKEQMAKGVQFPEEFFSIAPVSKAVIKIK